MEAQVYERFLQRFAVRSRPKSCPPRDETNTVSLPFITEDFVEKTSELVFLRRYRY